MIVRLATDSDANNAADLIGKAARWLDATSKWNDWPHDFPAEQLEAAISNNELYVTQSCSDGPLIGTFTLQWSDERFWGIRPADAGYLHRVAVAPGSMGRRVGECMIRWAAAEIDQRRRRYLRLDCAAENEQLQAYYERLGFAIKGERVGRSGYRGTLFEIEARSLLPRKEVPAGG